MIKRKKKLIYITSTVTIMCTLAGCGSISKANTPEEFMEDIISITNVKSLYSNVVDGDELLNNMNKVEKESINDTLKENSEKYKDNSIDVKVVSEDKETGYYKVAVGPEGSSIKSEKNVDIYYVVKTDDGYKLDLSITGKNEIDILRFESTNQEKAEAFNVYAKLGNTYKNEFKELKDEYYAIDLTTNYSVSTYYGYIKKDYEEGQALYELLKNGEELQLKLNLSIPEWIECNKDVFLIESIEKAQWGE